jgi:hypothetical protein
MFRALPALIAAAVLGLAAPPARADAATEVRALMAEITGRPVRQIRSTAAAPVALRTPPAIVAPAIVAPAAGPGRRALARLAPATSLRPPARPARLRLTVAPCRAVPAAPEPETAVCARPLHPAATGFAPPSARVALPSAAPGQMVIVTDGRVRVLRRN